MGNGEENHLDQMSIATEGNSYAVAVPPAVEAAPPIAKPQASGETVGAPGLPQTAAGADLPLSHKPLNRLWPISCFFVTFLLYVSLVPNIILYSSPPTGDQPFYLMEAASIAQDGDLNVKNNYDNKDYDTLYSLAPHPRGFVGMTTISAPYPLDRQIADTPTRPQSEQYSAHLPGLPFLLAPAWLVGSWFSLWWPATVVVMCLLGALLVTNVFLLTYELTAKTWIAIVVWLTIAFSNPIMTYSYMIFTEMPVGLLLIYAFRRLAMGWGANGRWRLLLVGLCIGYIPWLSLRCLPVSAVLALYAAVQWLRHTDPEGRLAFNKATILKLKSRVAIRSALWVLVPILVWVIVLVSYNLFRAGTLLPSSSEKGRVDHFYWPWAGGADMTRFLTAAFGLLLDQRWGLLPYAPVYLLTIIGVIAMFRTGRASDRRLLLWMALLSVPYMTLITAYEGWYGAWNPPARYLSTFIPLAAAPLAVSLYVLSRAWIPRVAYGLLYGALTAISLILMGFMMYDPRLMWTLPEWTVHIWLALDPAVPWHHNVDIRGIRTDFVQPDQVLHPLKSSQLIGASVLIVLVCYLLLLLAQRIGAARRLPSATRGAILVGALSIVSLGWYGMNYGYLKPKTIFTQQHRWDNAIKPPLDEPYGIAYLNGKVYVTSFARKMTGWVGEFDVKTGGYRRIQPISASGVVTFAHPSDVKVGPDGLLYVLNNGEGDQALLVMKPDGTVVSKHSLKDKTTIATGLYIAKDGSLYVADMQGGKVLKYARDGGDVVTTFLGMSKGFNNPADVVIGGDGTLYVTESGNQRIQVMAADGHFLREYDVGCRAVHLVMDGDWLDATCAQGMVSVNVRTNSMQSARFTVQDSTPENPTGLAYGPDKKTLYVLDAKTAASLIEYQVQH